MTECRFLGFDVNRWVLRFLLPPLAVTPVAAQTIAFYGVPPNTTVQCLSNGNASATLLAVTGAIPFGIASNQFAGLSTGSFLTINDVEIGSGQAGKINLANYLNTTA